MSDKKQKTQPNDLIWIARYTTIGLQDKIRRQEIVVYAETEVAAWDKAEQKLRDAGIVDYKINSLKRFL